MPLAGSAIDYKTLTALAQMQMDYITANTPIALRKPLGPVITAIAYANAMVGLTLQRLVQLALKAARLSTATGSDIDSFVFDFGLARQAAVSATGVVAFSRFTPAPTPIPIAVGTIVQTATNPPVQFQVVAPSVITTQTLLGSSTTTLKVASNYGMKVGDTISVEGLTFVSGTPTIGSLPDGQTIILTGTLSGAPGIGVTVTDLSLNGSYDSSTESYFLGFGLVNVFATIQAVIPGTSGNVLPNTIIRIGSTLPGIDTVTNGIGLTNGQDQETDLSLQERFALYILSLSKATKASIASAITNVQQGLVYSITEPFPAGPQDGTFTVVVDDGSGAMPTSTLSSVTAAVEQVRPIGVRAIVNAASILPIGLAERIQFNQLKTPDVLALQTAIRSFEATEVNSKKPGEVQHFSRFIKAAFGATSPGDAVTTSIAVSSSAAVTTTSVLQLLTVTGAKPGQLVFVEGFFTTTGELPRIVTIDSASQVTISPALTLIPPAGTEVTFFSITPEQIIDVDEVWTGTIAASTTLSGVTSGLIMAVTSAAGLAAGQYVIITDESGTVPVSYQASPSSGLLPRINSVVGTTVTLNTSVTAINSDGSLANAAPPIGARFVSFVGIMTDQTPSPSQVLRLRLSGANACLAQMEGIDG